MKKTVLIATGCDANFYPFMQQAIQSLQALHLDERAQIGIMDMGLTPEQLQALKAQGFLISKPERNEFYPNLPFKPYEIGYIARTMLRDYFPGFTVYLWFDADAWAQTDEFYDLMVDGANARGAAVVRENGHGYRRTWIYNRWWYGHMMMACGLVAGARVAAKPAVNTGILAIRDNAPHWDLWRSYYKTMAEKRNRIILDQHSFNAALEIEKLPSALLPARCNWISVLSTPVWDRETRMALEPGKGGKPISVLHMAGPDKHRLYHMKAVGGGMVEQSLTYKAVHG